jgi:hypothetical protein
MARDLCYNVPDDKAKIENEKKMLEYKAATLQSFANKFGYWKSKFYGIYIYLVL